MKKTLIAFFALSGLAMAASETVFTGTGEDLLSLSVSFGDITSAIVYESPVSNPVTAQIDHSESTSNVHFHGGNTFASDYTVSMWISTDSLKALTGNGQFLFAYGGTLATGTDTYGSNAIQFAWDEATGQGTLTIGRGRLDQDTKVMTFAPNAGDKKSATFALGEGALTNITVAVTGANQSQTATLYVNGGEAITLDSYNGNMNGNASHWSMFLNTGVEYGQVVLADTKVTEPSGLRALMYIPEPATATLSLLALAGLAVRRRRK